MIKQRSLAKLVILSFLTCGIYGFFFWWSYIKDINSVCMCDGRKSPNYLAVILLTAVTCGLYYLIWLYRQGERLRDMAPSYNITVKEGGGTVLAYHLLGAFVLNIASSVSSMAALAGGQYTVAVAGINDAALRDAVAALHIAPDAVMLLYFCGMVLFLLGVTLMLSAMNILIKNLNAIGTVYNQRCC